MAFVQTQTPVFLARNVFDWVNQYQTAVVTASTFASGREARKVSGYRRERAWWQPTSDGQALTPIGNWVLADLGVGNAEGVDSLYLDRGHNLWGQTVIVEGSDDATNFYVTRTFTVPAQPSTDFLGRYILAGQDPTSDVFAVTEEGALYVLFGYLTPRRAWRVRVPGAAAFIPAVTGLILGPRDQLLGYSTTFDDDQRQRTARSEVSDAGYEGVARTFSWRQIQVGMKYIGSDEYDTRLRTLMDLLFRRNQPTVIAMEYGNYPGRAWMYRFSGSSLAMPKTRVYRSGTFTFREVGASLS